MFVSSSRDVALRADAVELELEHALVVAGSSDATSSQVVVATSGSPRSGIVFLRMTLLVRSSARSDSSLPSQKTRFSGGTWRTTRFTASTLRCLMPRLFQALRGR